MWCVLGHVRLQTRQSQCRHGKKVYNKFLKNFFFIFYFPGLDGLPLPPPPALGGKVLDSWEYQQSVKAARLQASLGVGQIYICCCRMSLRRAMTP